MKKIQKYHSEVCKWIWRSMYINLQLEHWNVWGRWNSRRKMLKLHLGYRDITSVSTGGCFSFRFNKTCLCMSRTVCERWIVDRTFTSSDNTAPYKLYRRHMLHPLLPPQQEQHYLLRKRSHGYKLPEHTSSLNDSNCLTRMLYKNINRFDDICWHFVDILPYISNSFSGCGLSTTY